MELYREILVDAIQKSGIQVTFPGLQLNVAEIIEQRSYQALLEIQAIIRDDALTDEACFRRIEEYRGNCACIRASRQRWREPA